MISTEILGGGLGALLMLLVGGFILKNGRPRKRVSDKRDHARPLAPLEEAALTAQSEATKARLEREKADDAAREAIADRPHSSDPVADLEARLKSDKPT